MFTNELGFLSGQISTSVYGAWGACSSDPSVTVFEVFFSHEVQSKVPSENTSLNNLEPSNFIDDDLAEKICDFFSTFFEQDNSVTFKKNSTQHPAFDGFAVMPWLVPDIILLHFTATNAQKSFTWSFLENSLTWSEEDVPLEKFVDFLDYCKDNFIQFMQIYNQEFSTSGEYVGKLGKFGFQEYKPKN
jgi:hypothetical protein